MTAVRKLTEGGIAAFREYVEVLAAGGSDAPPIGLLTDAHTSEPLTAAPDLEGRTFASKREAAGYLQVQLAGLDRQEIDHNLGLWSWISLFYFDQVCPARSDGGRSPG